MLSACVAAVKCRHVLHHCVVIFFWSSGIIDCMFVFIWKWSSGYALGASVVWHLSFPLTNSFNKTEAAVFAFRPCFLRATLSSVQYNLLQLVLSACMTAVKCRPVLHHCVVIFFWSSEIIDCMFVFIWKWSSGYALGGVSGVASFITTDEQLQENQGCCSWALPFLQFITNWEHLVK